MPDISGYIRERVNSMTWTGHDIACKCTYRVAINYLYRYLTLTIKDFASTRSAIPSPSILPTASNQILVLAKTTNETIYVCIPTYGENYWTIYLKSLDAG